MDNFIVVMSTIPDQKTGQKIAKELLEKRLVACVTILPSAQSYYWWEGTITQEQEHLLVIKSRKELYSKIENQVLELHPYEVPEIIAIPLVSGYPSYLEWIATETSSSHAKSQT